MRRKKKVVTETDLCMNCFRDTDICELNENRGICDLCHDEEERFNDEIESMRDEELEL